MKDQLDFWLSKVTMYRLVTISLITLLGISSLLSLTGYFAFSFVSLLLSVGVLLAAVYGSGRLLGWVFGVRPHGESSIITALILACLFIPPELTALAFAKLALIGVFASTTKYILAIRGRHIFNPAASAALIAGLTGIGFAGWWIATPALLPVVIVAAILILHKTRRLQMGLLFVGLSTLFITVQSVLLGLAVWQGIWLALASYPLVFFAGVMLSEPLTQPPRRWQQLTLATGVAVVMMIPLHTPFLTMSPELALIIANAVAWCWGAHRALKLKFVEKIQLTPSSYEFVFAGNVPFTAGQYLEFSLPHKAADSRGIRRVFTIATNPSDANIRFGIKFYDRPSTFKQTLRDLKPGSVVPATRVAGDFVLPTDNREPILLVAGGIGITPFISFARHLIKTNEKREVILVYAVASAEEIAYKDILEKSGMRVTIVVPGGKANVPKTWQVIDAPFVSAELLQKEITDIMRRSVYISGAPLMVNAVARAAKKLGAKRIKTDHFTGY